MCRCHLWPSGAAEFIFPLTDLPLFYGPWCYSNIWPNAWKEKVSSCGLMLWRAPFDCLNQILWSVLQCWKELREHLLLMSSNVHRHLGWVSVVGNTCLWSSWSSGLFFFSLNRKNVHLLYLSLSFMLSIHWPLSNQPSTSERAHWPPGPEELVS